MFSCHSHIFIVITRQLILSATKFKKIQQKIMTKLKEITFRDKNFKSLLSIDECKGILYFKS